MDNKPNNKTDLEKENENKMKEKQESTNQENPGVEGNTQPQPTPSAKKLLKNKKLLIPTSIVAALLLITTTVYLFFNSQKPDTTPTNQPTPTQFSFKASVKYLTGKASKIVDERKVEIKEGDVLNEGDNIVTEDETRLVLELDEGTIIRLGDNTNITLSKLQAKETAIQEEQGVVFIRVEKDESHQFLAKAGDITVQSMGTVFSVEKEDEVKVKVFESKVAVKQEGQENVEVGKDQEWKSSDKKIEEINKQELATNEFYDWSLKEEKLITPTLTQTPTPTYKPATSGISLAGSKTDSGVSLSWSVSGIDVSNGLKLVKNLEGNPVYPGNEFKYLDSKTRSYTWKITDGKTWYFRICQYRDGKCGTYSNQVKVQVSGSGETSGSVSSISLSVSKVDNKANLSWSVNGNSPEGFKVVWSTNSGPTYPTREGDSFHYKSDPGTRSDTVGNLSAGHTYHFRVCEYLGGKCGAYSNEVSLGF